jgi:hypothetical protein
VDVAKKISSENMTCGCCKDKIFQKYDLWMLQRARVDEGSSS